MKRSVKIKPNRKPKRNQFAELSEGIESLAEARQGKRTPQTHTVGSGARKRSEDLKVFISLRDSKCDECGEELGRKAWITLEENKGALCLGCADLDELVFLPSGDAALTRRARRHSVLSAVVLKFSKARGRYERQGLLVEENALNQAEVECLADAEARERRAERERERRAELDQIYVKQFAKRIRELFSACPPNREVQIAEHACRKYSGRIGRSAVARSLDEAAVLLAVAAHIRHRETNYDELLAAAWDRADARAQVKGRVDELLRRWQTNTGDAGPATIGSQRPD